jgi:hypothetical protein
MQASRVPKRREVPLEKTKSKAKALEWASKKVEKEHEDDSSDVPEEDASSEAEYSDVENDSASGSEEISESDSGQRNEKPDVSQHIGPSNIPLEDYSDSSGDEVTFPIASQFLDLTAPGTARKSCWESANEVVRRARSYWVQCGR